MNYLVSRHVWIPTNVNNSKKQCQSDEMEVDAVQSNGKKGSGKNGENADSQKGGKKGKGKSDEHVE